MSKSDLPLLITYVFYKQDGDGKMPILGLQNFKNDAVVAICFIEFITEVG